jgi:hypothetical protein
MSDTAAWRKMPRQGTESIELIDNRRPSTKILAPHVDPALTGSSRSRKTGKTPPTKETTMRVMVIVKADANSETGKVPTAKELLAMGAYNDELIKAGVMLSGEGLLQSSTGKRVRFSKGTKTVVDGPFSEAKELVAGFWIWKVKSMEDAVEWVKRAPADAFVETEIEIRRIAEADDFGDSMTPEVRAQEDRQRKELEGRRG